MGHTAKFILKNDSSTKSIEVAKKIRKEINFIKLNYSKIASFKKGIALEYSTTEFFISIEIDKNGEIYVVYKKLYKFAGTRKVNYIKLYSFLEKLVKIA